MTVGAREPRNPIIGILGGMGPAATADFYAKIVRSTPALRDQDHPQAVIWSDPSIPDRTTALRGSGPHPGPKLMEGARKLESAGATLIAVPCNTAHAFLAEIQAAVDIPVLNMVEETRDLVLECGLAPGSVVALLATEGTLRARLYQHVFARTGIDVLLPNAADQQLVNEAIALVKADAADPRAGQLLADVVRDFERAGVRAIIAGCTELPIGLGQVGGLEAEVIDPTEALATAVVREVLSYSESDDEEKAAGQQVAPGLEYEPGVQSAPARHTNVGGETQ